MKKNNFLFSENHWFYKNPYISLFGITILTRIVLILFLPVVTGEDTHGRLLHREEALFVHWLPITQMAVKYFFILTKSLVGVRIGFAIFGSLLVLVFYKIMSGWYDSKDSYLGAIFYSFTPMIVYLGSIPYQETLLMLFILSSLLFSSQGNVKLSILTFGLACLTRYEAWLLGPFWAYLLFWDRNNKLDITNFTRKSMFLFFYTWGIVAWLLINYIVYGDPFSFKRKYSFVNNVDSKQYEYVKSIGVQVLWVIKYGGLLSIFAIIGIWNKGKEYYNKSKEQRVFFLWVILLIIVIPVLVINYNNSGRFVIALLTLLTIFIPAGINFIFKKSKYRAYVVLLSILYLVSHSLLYIYYVSNKPKYSIAYEVIRFIDENVSEKKKAIMISEGFIEYPQADPLFYSRSVGQTTCGRSCTYTAKDLPITNEKDLELFIESNSIFYFIINGDYDSFDEQERICKKYISKNNFTSFNDMGHTRIYKILNSKSSIIN